jgi:hypothetical protein
MTRLAGLLRDIGHDLVEKRLWPVAAVLAIGILAVPLVLGGGDPVAAPAPLPGAATADAPAQAVQIALAQPEMLGAKRRGGTLRDPFARRKVQTQPLVDAPSAGGGLPAPDNLVPGMPDLPGSGGMPPLDDFLPLPGGSAPPAPSPPALPSVAVDDVVTVRVGRAGQLRTRTDVEARTPLPSVEDPFLVFLGVKPDGVSAQFLVSADAAPTGDGVCRPSKDLCEEIVMKAGDTEFFDVTLDDGSVVQYQMVVVRVGRK